MSNDSEPTSRSLSVPRGQSLALRPRNALVTRGLREIGQVDNSRAQELLDRALSSYYDECSNQGLDSGYVLDFGKVIADCTEAIHLNPKCFQAYYLRGMASADLDNAIADFSCAARLGMDNGLPMNAPLHPDILLAATKLVAKFVKAEALKIAAEIESGTLTFAEAIESGTLKFADFLKLAADKLGQEKVDRVQPELRAGWEDFRKTGEVPEMEAILPAAEEPTTPPPRHPEEQAEEPPRPK